MTRSTLDLATLNTMSEREFAAALGDIYEHGEWVAVAVAKGRPFRDVCDVAEAMAAAVWDAGDATQLALLRAHPELGQPGKLAPESAREQAEGGIDRLSGERARRLACLNAAYRERFGFPFIVAVRGQRDVDAIVRAVETRLAHTAEEEHRAALTEVHRIAALRLARRFGADDGAVPETQRMTP